MRNLYEEFKEFAVKGNLLEIAVGLVLALAFKDVVTSLIDNVLTPIIAAIFGQPDFSRLSIHVGESEILYGTFVNAVLGFFLIALALFLFVVKPYNAMKAKQEAGDEDAPAPPEDITLLREIRDALQR